MFKTQGFSTFQQQNIDCGFRTLTFSIALSLNQQQFSCKKHVSADMYYMFNGLSFILYITIRCVISIRCCLKRQCQFVLGNACKVVKNGLCLDVEG